MKNQAKGVMNERRVTIPVATLCSSIVVIQLRR